VAAAQRARACAQQLARSAGGRRSAHGGVDAAVGEDLVVRKVVRQPAALLPKNGEEQRGAELDAGRARAGRQREHDGRHAQRRRARDEARVVDHVRLEHARRRHLRRQRAHVLLKRRHGRRGAAAARRRRGWLNVGDKQAVELGQRALGPRVERAENVRGVGAQVRRQHGAAGVRRQVALGRVRLAVDNQQLARRRLGAGKKRRLLNQTFAAHVARRRAGRSSRRHGGGEGARWR
jgi:hypothetical protein